MSEDKIEEIRARYAGYSLENFGNAHLANEDRGWLLAEVDRLRAEIERLRADEAALREIMKQVNHVLARAFDRIHQMPRTSDTELARAIGTVNGKIQKLLARAALEGKP